MHVTKIHSFRYKMHLSIKLFRQSNALDKSRFSLISFILMLGVSSVEAKAEIWSGWCQHLGRSAVGESAAASFRQCLADCNERQSQPNVDEGYYCQAEGIHNQGVRPSGNFQYVTFKYSVLHKTVAAYKVPLDFVTDAPSCAPGYQAPFFGGTCTAAPLNIGPPSCLNPSAGNPTLLSTGVKYEPSLDYASPAPSKLRIFREYNSYSNKWVFGHEYRILKYPNGSYELTESSGRKVVFDAVASGFEARHYKSYALEYMDSIVKVNVNGETLFFDTLGHLFKREYSDSYQEEYNRNNFGSVTTITTNRGNVAEIHYVPGTDNIDFITVDGVTLTYGWSGSQLQTFSVNGELQVQYGYHPKGELAFKLDGKNNVISQWQYDDFGRVILNSRSNGFDTYQFEYLSNRVTRVRNPLGRWTQYSFMDVSNQLLRPISVLGEPSTHCAAANQYKSYYPNGTLQTQTDWEGNVTLFERDNVGRITQKTEALKWPANPQYGLAVDTSILQTTANTKITKTCWHSTHNKPQRIIEPSSVTHFNYFGSGQLKSKKVEPRTSTNEKCL